ncbi:MAG: universal stress protein [Desulfobacula sp.]|uniref:universal stress protein n=1 Tax=Desulfobacula sp. TaxID=2593537 RepID=UPI0025C1FFE7|nr:universal stress protein [Desulfobacula sp.]MCD4721928.1 universal stress protein [Desulfobacula sp.]
MFKKILFATDATPVCEIAAKTAFELSEKYGSELILVHVVADFFQGTCPFVPDMPGKEKTLSVPEYTAFVKEGMKKNYGFLAKRFGDPEYKVIKGKSWEEILKFALKIKVDCIIMGAHAQKEASAEKTLQKVAQKAHCPVLSIARPCETSFWYFNRIIFGTDFSKASMSAFQFAYKLADYIGCKLHIFHALDIESSGTGDIPGQKQIEDQIKEAKARIEELYVSQMENFDNYDMAVWEGIPYVELLKFARETSGDLIVMAHHTKDIDSEKAFFSHTIDQVVFRSACPVVSVNKYCNFK